MYHRRKTYRRKYIRRTGRSFRRTRRLVKRTVLNMAETKFYLPLSEELVIRSTKQVRSFFDNIPIGTNNSSRIGSQVRSKRIGFRIQFGWNTGANNVFEAFVRVAVVYPRKGNGGVDWQSAISPVGINDYFPPSTVMVLYDKVWSLGSNGPNTSAGAIPSLRNIKISKKFYGIINYRGNSCDREPLLVIWSDLPDGTGSGIECRLALRTSYKDM